MWIMGIYGVCFGFLTEPDESKFPGNKDAEREHEFLFSFLF